MRPFSAALNTLRRASLSRNWDLNDEEYMKIFSSMLYIVLEQQWISSTMAAGCQWSSRSRTILERIAAGSGPVIAENALRTSTNKEVWIASILGNWEAMGLNFRIPHTKGMWGKRKNECQGLQSFLHTLISLLFLRPAVHPPTAVGFPLLCNQRDAQWLRIVNIIVTQTNGFGLTSRRGTLWARLLCRKTHWQGTY